MVKPELPKPSTIEKEKMQRNADVKHLVKGTKLFRYGLLFSLIGSLLIIAEGAKIILFSPLPYQIQLLAEWGGYLDLIFGVIALAGLLCIVYARSHTRIKTISAATIALLSVLSFVFFGGGFYLGFILGLFGALLTAARE